MKLFQRLLVAPAALGLLAPLAANAAEVNINDVSQFTGSKSTASVLRAPSSVQFSDVVPGDWAYTALQNLSESYGCVDNAYTQTLKNGQALTRYEAAALINACLDGGLSADGQGLTSEAARLTNEFGSEMAILKGRVDGLEYKLNELSAGQFSSTTKLNGKVTFNTMGLSGVDDNTTSNIDDNVHMTYRAKYDLYTSFTGEDQLYTRLVTGNGGSSWSENTSHGLHLSDSANYSDEIHVDKIWYQFPVGDFTVWAGPRVENYYMLASAPSIYKPMMKQFALGGNAATYGSSTSGGFGVAWTQAVEDRSQPRFAVSTNYVSKGSADATKGIASEEAAGKWLSKFEYGSPRWQVSLAVAKHFCDENDPARTSGTSSYECYEWASYYGTDAGHKNTGSSTAYALRAYWKPEEVGMVPEIQLGYDWVNIEADGSTALATGDTESAAAWMAGLTWKDALIDGNRLALAFGQPQRATEIVGGGDADAAEDAFTWELYYDYKVTDGITITPAIFGSTDRVDGASNDADDFFGGILQTTFSF